MDYIELKPVGRRVSCLGLGCARLDGRIGLRRSAQLVETALELGINYFDVAAAYGTAEEALGKVLGNSREVVIATKVGPPRPPYNSTKMLFKTIVRPILDRTLKLKTMLRKAVSTPPATTTTRPRYDFSRGAIERSLEESLKRLRRDRVDVFLAHEPNRLDLVPEIEATFQSLVERQLVSAFGVGIGASEDQWAPFGSIWQSAWPGDKISSYTRDVTYLFHGVLRHAPKDRFGSPVVSPAELIRTARRASPNSVLVVSASTPARLRELVKAVESESV
ncbi:MAG: aldo/keto reductase [Planctomycetaceae bacterium]